MDRQWKLGEDLHPTDNALDPITFEDIVDSLRCGEKIIDRRAIQKVVKRIMEIRIQDFKYLIKNNIDEIIAEAAKGRE